MQTTHDADPLFLDNNNNNNVPSTAINKILLEEVWNDNLQFLKKLIERKNHGEQVGYGPIHFAASLGNVELMEMLLSQGFDKNERDEHGNPPLMWIIACEGREELMESLIDHGASVDIQNFEGESSLFLASQRGLYSKVQFLVENGADVNIVNLEGASPLHAAAARGEKRIIKLLVKYGAHLNAVDDEGDSPLHWAVREGEHKAASLLVKLGADIHLCNEDGETPKDLALCWDDADMARELIMSGTNANGSRVVVVENCWTFREPASELSNETKFYSQLQALDVNDQDNFLFNPMDTLLAMQ